MSGLRRLFLSIFSLVSISPVLFLVSCGSEADLTTDVKNDSSSNYTFYSSRPEDAEDSFWVTISYKIGTVLDKNSLSTSTSKDFASKKPGYTIDGWVYYKNPLSGDTEIPENIDTEGEIVSKILVLSPPAAFYVSRWSPVSYSVTFYGNGGYDAGGNTMQTQANFTYDEAQVLNVNPFSREGYVFNGWGTKANQSPNSPEYTDGETVMNLCAEENGTCALYALWAKEKITISFDAGEGSGTMESIKVSVGDSLPDYIETIAVLTAPEGKNFGGWLWERHEGDIIYYQWYSPGETFTSENYPNENITLVAQWNDISYQVYFETNGGTIVDPQWITINSYASEPEVPYKAGYDFAGWYSDENLMTEFSFSTPITQDTKLYAKWKAQTVTNNTGITYTETNEEIIFTSPDSGATYQWMLDRRILADEVTNTYVVKKADYAGDTSTHTVAVLIYDSNGRPVMYSAQFCITP